MSVENQKKPVWKLDDGEFLAEFKRRTADSAILDALEKVKRMCQITADNKPQFTPGLKVAMGLIDTYAIQFGGTAKIDLHALLADHQPGTEEAHGFISQSPPDRQDFVPGKTVTLKVKKPGGKRGPGADPNSKAGRVRSYLLALAPGTLFGVADIQLPDVDYQTAYMALKTSNVVEKLGRGKFRRKEAA